MRPLRSELRWHVKKIARRACIAAGGLLARSQGNVRVLTYHRFATARRDAFAVEPSVFARQMEWIAAQGAAVSLNDVLDFMAGRRSLPQGSVLVTIDDGYESVHSVALPQLQRHGVPAVAFIPPALLDRPAADDPEPRLSWSQVRELVAAGIEIGSHGWSHRSFGGMDADEMHLEARRSREILEGRTGRAVLSFAYPFGTRADYGIVSAMVLRRLGYRCAFTAQHGSIDDAADVFELPRVKIEGGEDMWVFSRSCYGGLDAWGLVDRHLSGLQARQA
jgi:peptidoglycan/xylan/chitin deacetylase (PgdA/CDA1 family)